MRRKLIDLEHPAAAEYLRSKGVDIESILGPLTPAPARSSDTDGEDHSDRSDAPDKEPEEPPRGPREVLPQRSEVEASPPSNVVQLRPRTQAPTTPRPTPRTPPPPAPPPPPPRPPDSPKTTATAGAPEALRAIEGLEHLTLNELVQRFGPVSAFKEWLQARKTIADVRRIELQNAQTRSELVSLELVEKLVFGRIDAAFKRILADASKRIAVELGQAMEAGATVEELETAVRHELNKLLAPAKADAKKALRRA